MSTKHNLDLAKLKADDEFYTQFVDIAAELTHWLDKLRGKNIICPCDFKPTKNISSLTIDFEKNIFCINSVKLKTKEDYCQIFGEFSFSFASKEEITKSKVREILANQESVNFINYLLAVGREAGIKSVTASGYDIKTGYGNSFDDIDYSKYDLCITNPPFSLYGAFISCLMAEYERNSNFGFILISPFINRNAPCIAEPLMERKIYLGYGRHLAMNFMNPTGGKGKKVAVDWVVTWPDAQEKVDQLDQSTGISYDKLAYKEMPYMTMKDGTKPLKIKSITEIPDDYNGYMFTSVAVLDKLSYKKYEWICTGCKGYFNKKHPELNPFAHKVDNTMIGYGTDDSCFHGVLFKKK